METKEKLLCVLRIMMDTDRESPLNAVQVTKKLKSEYGIDNADRTGIYSDFALLERCGFHLIEASNRNHGKYMEHAFTDAELKIMIDAIRSAKCLNPEDTARVVTKLKNQSSERGRRRMARLVPPPEGNKSENRQAEECIELILEACYHNKQIAFQYTQFDRNMNRILRRDGQTYNFTVFSLYWSNNTYYLIGMDNKHPDLGSYRLDRIVNMQIDEQTALDPAEKLGSDYADQIGRYIEENVNHFGGEPIHLQLECEPGQRELDILYDFAGKDLHIRDAENGRILVTVDKRDSEALTSWLMQYAHMFKAVGPDQVKEKLMDRIEQVRKLYEE